MIPFYNTIITLYGFSIRVAAVFSQKAKLWVEGRRDVFPQLSTAIQTKPSWVWFHVSSLGEFEQGRPLIEKIRKAHPGTGILLTFFSPSGYLLRKDYPHADYITYMPLDTLRNARRFIDIVNPRLAVFVKYDIWYNHLLALERAAVPTVLISAHLRANQIYFRWPGRFIGKRLRNLTQIFAQTHACAEMLREKGFTNVTHTGDTRLDRVMEIAAAPRDFTWLRKCLPSSPVLIAGSTWPTDEERLLPAVRQHDIALIIAPHEIHEERLRMLEAQLPGARRLSQLKSLPADTRIVLVDTIGDLAHLYAIGALAYIGGGFGKGIHNILEPAAHGLPMMFGPHYHKFPEALELINLNAAQSIHTTAEVSIAINSFTNADRLNEVRSAIKSYTEKQRGATQRIYEALKEIFGR